MAQIIGNDGGGIVITSHGVRRIPRWDPALLRELRAVAALANAGPQLPGKVREELAPLTTKLAGMVVTQVENIAGDVDGETTLVYDDVEGGFKCGSTGKTPIPIPPRRFTSNASQVLASHLLEMQLFQLGDSGKAQAAERIEAGG